MTIAWTTANARHLLNRAGFLASPQEVEASLKLGLAETVRRLIAGESITDSNADLLAFDQLLADGRNLDASKIGDQQTYWLYRMAHSQAPLIEKMVLFWHGHFATSVQKVKNVSLMVRQNELFRAIGLGSFHDLVDEVSKDAAMMIYLDTNSNRKGSPNENYAREVMELFTIGVGNYTEDDVKGGAKAFTGWTANKDTGDVVFHPKQHDDSIKTVFGQSGNFDEPGMIDVIFSQKSLPVFIANKLLAFFGSTAPTQAWAGEVAANVAQLQTIGQVLSSLFQSDTFYASENQGSLFKSPAEYVAGIIKALQLPMSGKYAGAMRGMGQQLFLPPNVAGWRGGAAWLMSSSLLARCHFAETAARAAKPASLALSNPALTNLDANGWVSLMAQNLGMDAVSPQSAAVLAQYANDTFIHSKQKNTGMRGLWQLMLVSPDAQMK